MNELKKLMVATVVSKASAELSGTSPMPSSQHVSLHPLPTGSSPRRPAPCLCMPLVTVTSAELGTDRANSGWSADVAAAGGGCQIKAHLYCPLGGLRSDPAQGGAGQKPGSALPGNPLLPTLGALTTYFLSLNRRPDKTGQGTLVWKKGASPG